MAKVKFEAEDFKKDSNTSQINPRPTHLQKYWKWYGGAVAAACIAGAVFFWPKGEVTPPTPPTGVDSLEHVVDTSTVVTPDTTTIAKESTSNEEKTTETGTKTVNGEQKDSETEIVNNPPVAQSGDITMDAKKAIRGDFGNGAERRKNLGTNYDKVQAVVNKMYQEGNLHW